ncbi:hypothetical protein DLY71_09050 [Escherichia coli]|nr:hypothetical protein [Escherichia coli]EGE3094410.1 hypothetical protein [Escherichia coli]PXA39176.1 hypothetical protein DMC13_17435 [Escherichia coli]
MRLIHVEYSVNTLPYQPHHHCFRQHLLPLLFTYSAAKQFPIPGVYLANIHQCDRFLYRIYGNA